MKRNLVSLSLLLLLPLIIEASPVTDQLSKEQVRQAVVDEVISTAFSVIKRSKPGSDQLMFAFTSRGLRINNDEEAGSSCAGNSADCAGAGATDEAGTPNAGTTPQNLSQLLPVKERMIKELPFELKEYIFDELGEKLLDKDNTRPFNIPKLGICQWDAFVLIMHILLEGESRFDQLVCALDSCYGLPTHKLWKLQPALNKEPILKVIPINFQNKFFTKDPKKLASIVYRIQGLINTK